MRLSIFLRRAVVCFGLLLVMPAPVLAGSASRLDEEDTIGRCIQGAADGRPWLEKTLWGLRDKEAGWIGAAIGNRNGTEDLGPLQVNSWWVPRIAALVKRPEGHIRYWLRYDACFNAQAARWIFLSALSETGDYWRAIGRYHSPTRWRQLRYTADVSSRLQRRFGPSIFAPR